MLTGPVLPGVSALAAVALAALAAWILARRRGERAPGGVALLLGALPVLLLAGMVAAGGVPAGARVAPAGAGVREATVAHAVLPAQVEVRRAVGRGEWPLWIPYTGAGKPLLAFPEAQALHPLAVPGWIFPPHLAAAVTAGLQWLVALFGGFLLLRRAGAAAASAAAGAVVYALGAGAAPWLGMPGAHAVALLPGVLWAVRRASDPVEGASAGGRRRDLALLVALLAAVLLGGDPAAAVVVLVTALAFLLALLRRRAPRHRSGELLRQLACLVLAAGLAAPVLLPAVAWEGQTGGAAAAAAAAAEHLRRDPLNLATLADAERRDEAWRDSGRRLSALLGMAVPPADPASGAAAPGPAPAHRGATERAQDPAPRGGVAPVPGPDRDLRTAMRRGRWPGDGGVAAATALLAAAMLAGAWPRRRRLLAPPLPHRGFFAAAGLLAVLVAVRPPVVDSVLVWLHAPAAVTAPWPRVLPVAGLAAAWFVASALQRLARPVRPGLAAVAVVLVVAARAAVLAESEPPPASLRSAPQVVAFLQARQAAVGGGRLVALGGLLAPHASSLHGLADARGLPAIHGAAWGEVVRPVLAGDDGTFGPADHSLYALLGVRWVVAAPEVAVPPPARAVARFADAVVWERPAIPRLFLPESAERFTGGDWRPMVWNRADFVASSLYNPGGGDPAEPRSTTWRRRSGGDSVTPRTEHPARLDARTRLDEPRLLATSIYQDGGWRLLADGTARPTTFANGPFVAAWLPAGTSRITLLYRPPGLLAGAALCALAAAWLALWLVPPPRLGWGR